ncbi:MAG: hypothetical protein ACR2MX_08370, partial [Cyclobacteriaceae bacterium]
MDKQTSSNETDGQNQENSQVTETKGENKPEESSAGNESETVEKEQTQEEVLDALLAETAEKSKPTHESHNFDGGLQKMQKKISALSKQIEDLTNVSLKANKSGDIDPLDGLDDDNMMDVGAMRRSMKHMQTRHDRQTEALMTRIEKMQQETADQIQKQTPKQSY